MESINRQMLKQQDRMETEMRKAVRRLFWLLALTVTTLLLTPQISLGHTGTPTDNAYTSTSANVQSGNLSDDDDEVRVVRPGATVAGKKIGEWTGRWWKAAIEAVDFPFPAGVSQPGALGDLGGPVFFAVASPGPGSTTYTYDVPRGKYVLLPLFTFAWLTQTGAPCSDFDCSRAVADSFVFATTSMSVRIDGKRVAALFDHYEATPHLFRATAPLGGWWAGTDPASAGLWHGFTSGFWLMLKPPSPGRHVLSIAVEAPTCGDANCDIPGPLELEQTKLILTVPR